MLEVLIKELILKNFMSYEYARIPLKSGLNLICGPNGSGKSSILLAIGLALGASYTERSQRLSDLIRYGQERAEIILHLDNSKRHGERPFPEIDEDTITLSRILQKNGDYPYEINYKVVTKSEVTSMLSKFNFNPNNPLLIMHQGMVEYLVSTSPQQKLQLVEEAVGIGKLRQHIMAAAENLNKIAQEKKDINMLIQSAKQTLDYWKKEYDRLSLKKQLEIKRIHLERMMAWARVRDHEERIQRHNSELQNLESHKMKLHEEISNLQSNVNEKKIRIQEHIEEKLAIIEECIKGKIEREKGILTIRTFQSELAAKMDELLKDVSKLAETKFELKLVDYKIEENRRTLRRILRELERLKAEARKFGPRVSVKKSMEEIQTELYETLGKLTALTDVSPDAEELYNAYQSEYDELLRRAEQLEAAHKKAVEAVSKRVEKWRHAIQNVISEANKEFKRILTKLDGVGEITIINEHDFNNAGLLINVGFKGGPLRPLNSYTQSGGERSTTIMAFILSLYKNMSSPLRALDEFDVHMDPRNRSILMNILISTTKIENCQLIVITPSFPPVLDESTHVLMVQKTAGVSKVMEIAQEARNKR